MRPIDADALMKCFSLKSVPGAYFPYITIRDLFATMAQLPTLTLDEMRPKGEWNIFEHDHEFYAECPECKHIRTAHDATEMNFCPCCGMDMGGNK